MEGEVVESSDRGTAGKDAVAVRASLHFSVRATLLIDSAMIYYRSKTLRASKGRA
jgi:hypothetical protein